MAENEGLLAELRKQLGSLDNLRTLLGETLFAEKKAALLAQYRIDTDGGDVVGVIRIEDGDYVRGDKHIHLDPATASLDDLRRAYYRSLAAECRRLPLGVVDPQFAQPGKGGEVGLDAVYVDLDVAAPAREKSEDLHGWGLRLARGEGSERIALLEALSQPAAVKAVLVGDAGSGKTTFVNYLTALLAEHAAGGARPELPEALLGRWPVRLLLREAATCIPAESACGNAEMLWSALKADMVNRLGTMAADRLLPYLQDHLLREGGLFLLDGLDEVPEAGRRRGCLLQAVEALVRSLPEHSRLVLTARPYAYADSAWQLSGIPVLALAPFNERQVEGFVKRWCEAARPAMGWNVEMAQGRAEQLTRALQERPYLADLASRPLLLTLMAALHSSRSQLPEGRAELYEESVKLLLGRWQRGREVIIDGKPLLEPGIEKALGVGDEKIREVLEKLALETHERQRAQARRDEEPADIGQAEVLAAFAEISEEVHPGLILKYLDQRAGLLIGRRPGIYTFLHRSFQEYLAACYLAETAEDFGEALRVLVYVDAKWWREVFLLGVGKQNLSIAAQVVNVLIPRPVEKVREPGDAAWRAAVLAGQALVDLRLVEKAGGKPHLEDLLERVRDWLAALVSGGYLSVKERAEAGDVLGRLGDIRKGVGLRVDGLPDIDWVEIPAGPFVMGSREDEPDTDDDEKPQHTVELPAYRISRYLVTNAQFQPFVEGDGYGNPEYWTAEGWAWRQGAEADMSVWDEHKAEDFKKRYREWLAGRPVEKRDRPFWWSDPQWGAQNRPVVGITWYEAMAYCVWLGRKLGKTVRLPSEAEWEKAARGPAPATGRYPWGMEWREGCANTEEAGLQQTSVVGMFPAGGGAYGVQDMVGNVWEWTRSRYGDRNVLKCDYPYPYAVDDGRERVAGMKLPVLRGGSWNLEPHFARCAFRLRGITGDFSYNVGLRVLLSLVSADSGF